MAYRDRPEYVTEDSQRCEAMARGAGGEWQVWKRVDRRCVRRACQMRDGRAVCFQHAEVREVRYV